MAPKTVAQMAAAKDWIMSEDRNGQPGTESVKRYVAGFANDASAISFRWNGRHEEQFEDANELFRCAVIERVIEHPDEAPLSLTVELYRALTEYSTEAWSIDERVEDLALLMLKKGGSAVARDYIIGAMQSFDAQCATVFAGCPRDVAEECVALAQSKLRSDKNEDERQIWEVGLERFEILLKHAA